MSEFNQFLADYPLLALAVGVLGGCLAPLLFGLFRSARPGKSAYERALALAGDRRDLAARRLGRLREPARAPAFGDLGWAVYCRLTEPATHVMTLRVVPVRGREATVAESAGHGGTVNAVFGRGRFGRAVLTALRAGNADLRPLLGRAEYRLLARAAWRLRAYLEAAAAAEGLAADWLTANQVAGLAAPAGPGRGQGGEARVPAQVHDRDRGRRPEAPAEQARRAAGNYPG